MVNFDNKKSFAFSFLALFISFLIFSFAGLILFQGDNEHQINFKNSRILAVNSEFKYFKEVYFINSLKYSLYNSLDVIRAEAKVNKTFLNEINKNYSKFNSYLKESILNGTLYGKNIPFMENKSLNYFLDQYFNSFGENHKSSLNVTIININAFEDKPYYVNLQVFLNFNLTMNDNLSNWIFNDSIIVSVPTYNLEDPSFSYYTSSNVNIRPVEYYLSNLDWDLDSFNNTLFNSYAFTYAEPNHNYLIGNSYIKRLLNISISSYDSVIGFWSFDNDLYYGGVFDSSLNYNLSKLYGNSYSILNFDDGNTTDITAYNNTFEKIGDVDCSILGLNGMGCYFDGSGDSLRIKNDKFNLNFTNKITITAWINPNSYYDPLSTDNVSEIFRYGLNSNEVIDLRIKNNGILEMEIGNHSNGLFYSFVSNENISLGNWTFVAGSFNGDTGEGKLYINGKLVNLNYDLTIPKSAPISNFLKSNNNVSIGNILPTLTEGFDGLIDEVGIYTKVLSDDEINRLYDEKKVKFIEYVDSLHGKGIEFDGADDYINLTTKNNILSILGQESYSVEIWFKPYELNKSFNLFIQKDTLDIGYDNLSKRFYFGDNRLLYTYSSVFDINKSKYYYLVIIRNKGGNRNQFYIDGELIGDVPAIGWNPLNSGSETSFASGNFPNGALTNSFFNGLIDEIKITNKTLTQDEIKRNYYNYDSFSKGLANYIVPINPNKFGFNTPAYGDLVSYSDKLFFDYYFRNLNRNINITLFNVTNITSSQFSENYYNFLVDICLKVAYSIDTYNHTFSPSRVVKFGNDSGDCNVLVSKGIY
jgi:hypothetical protein